MWAAATAVRPALAENLDAVLGYLIAADQTTWGIGGNLGIIRPALLEDVPDPAAKRSGGWRARGTYGDYYRTGAMESSHASFRRWFEGEGFWQSPAPLPWTIRVAGGEQRNRLTVATGASRQSVTASSHRWTTTAGGNLRYRFIAAGARWNWDPQRRPEPAAVVSFDWRQRGELALLWQRHYPFWKVDAQWHDQRALFEIPGLREGMQGWLAIRAFHPWRVEIRLSRYNWVRGDEESLTTTLEPWGHDASDHAFLSFDGVGWTALAGTRGLTVDLQAYGMKGSLPYAKITHGDFETRAYFVSFERRLAARKTCLLGEVERLDWNGYGRGHTEFWPFTSGWVDLLGLRRYFITELSGHLWRYHAAGNGTLGRSWFWGAGLNIVDAYSSASVEHWRPEFLTFGKTDDQLHVWDLYRVLGGALSLAVRYKPAHWEIAYQAQQVIPIKTWRHRAAGAPSPEPSGGEQKKGRAYGGAWHRVSVGWNF
jgi:hypothetical protein